MSLSTSPEHFHPSKVKPWKGNYGGLITRGVLTGLPCRQRPDRRHHLLDRHVIGFVNAEAFAASLGSPFTALLTIHWRCSQTFREVSATGSPADISQMWAARLSRFTDKLSRWLKRNGVPVAFAWINETGRMYGEHTHMLLHLPHPRRIAAPETFASLKAKLIDFTITTEGFDPDGCDRRGKTWLPVTIRTGLFGMHTVRTRSGAYRYVLKGMSSDDLIHIGSGRISKAALLGVDVKRNARPIDNKRFGASMATIGPKARHVAGWRELMSLEELRQRLKPH